MSTVNSDNRDGVGGKTVNTNSTNYFETSISFRDSSEERQAWCHPGSKGLPRQIPRSEPTLPC